MASKELYFETDDSHPIDIVEILAEDRAWTFDRAGEDQISIQVEGVWRIYNVSLAWSEYDETLRMIVSFDMEPPSSRLSALYETLNLANDKCWLGGFSLWQDQGVMAYRYGMILSGGGIASREQIDKVMRDGVSACERFYPAFQLVCWGDESPKEAMNIAISEVYGRA